MNSSDVEYLKCRAALSASRMNHLARGLPEKAANAVDVSGLVREHPIGSVAGTFAVCALVTRSLASSSANSSKCAENDSKAGEKEPEKVSIAESTFLAALISPLLSFASRQLLSRLIS